MSSTPPKRPTEKTPIVGPAKPTVSQRATNFLLYGFLISIALHVLVGPLVVVVALLGSRRADHTERRRGILCQPGVHGDREASFPIQGRAQGVRHLAADARLQVVLGQIVAHGQQQRAVQQAEGTRQADESDLPRGDVRALFEGRDDVAPDPCELFIL